jgi:hypothetical protein
VPAPATIDRFVVEREAGRGGMGVIYQARDPASGDHVAIKVLLGRDEVDRQRFEREGAILARLEHAAIVRYLGRGETAQGEPYLAMQWLDGVTVRELLRERALGVAEAASICQQAAAALAAAHAAGLVHRDVTASNLFLRAGDVDRVVLIDFGIARAYGAGPALTRTGLVIGTPGYMSPEQARGEADVDARSDVFSLGAVLYRCLTGHPAFGGEHAVAILAKTIAEDPPPPSAWCKLPPELDALVVRMLAKEPDQRPRDMLAVERELTELAPLLDARAPVAHAVRAGGDSALTLIERKMIVFALVAPGSAAVDIVDSVRADVLMSGDTLLTVPEVPARDQALRLAYAARELARLADPPIVIAAGRGEAGVPLGAAIDAAAAALARARPGRVSADAQVAQLLRGAFELVPGPAGLELVESHGSAATRFAPAPWVGRERELTLVLGMWDECVQDRVAHCVLVTGPGGIGKSRLLEQLAERIEATSARVLRVARTDVVRGQPFALVLRLLGALPGADEPHARARSLIDDRARQDAVTLIARAEDLQDRLRHMLAACLHNACADMPVALVLDDASGADAPSLDLLGDVIAQGGGPLLVIASARDDAAVAGLDRRASAMRVPLAALPPRVVAELATQLAGQDLPPATLATVVERGQGVPLFIEELVAGALRGESALPSAIAAAIEARLAALPAASRLVLRAASIAGSGGDAGLIADLVGASDVRAHLRRLEREGLLVPDGDQAWRFRHGLVRDSVYAMLTDDDRRRGHRVVAGHLARGSSQDPAAIAEHFEHAGIADEAARWYLNAAHAALQGTDTVGACNWAVRALELGLPEEDRAAACLVAAEAAQWLGDMDRAEPLSARGMQAARAGTAIWYAHASVRATILARLGRWDDVHELAAAISAAAGDDDVEGARADALARGALTAYGQGRRGDFIALAGAAERVRSAGHGQTTRARFEAMRALLASERVDVRGCLDAYTTAIELAERAGSAREACFGRLRLVSTLWWLGDLAAADPAARALADRIASLGAHRLVGPALGLQAAIAHSLGDRERAVALARRAGGNALAGTVIAAAALDAGELAAAREAAELAERSARFDRDFAARARALADLAAARAGSARPAPPDLRALPGTDRIGSPFGMAAWAVAETVATTDGPERAATVARDALAMIEQLADRLAATGADRRAFLALREHRELYAIASRQRS